MPSAPFIAQHRNGASDHDPKAEQNMDANNRQEERIGGRYRDAQNDCRAFVCHAWSRMRSGLMPNCGAWHRSYNRRSHARSVGTRRPSKCQQTSACSFTTARAAERDCSPFRVAAAFSVRMAPCRVRPTGRRAMLNPEVRQHLQGLAQSFSSS